MHQNELKAAGELSTNPDDDQIESHDAIFYVHDATLWNIIETSWNKVFFNTVHFLFVL